MICISFVNSKKKCIISFVTQKYIKGFRNNSTKQNKKKNFKTKNNKVSYTMYLGGICLIR